MQRSCVRAKIYFKFLPEKTNLQNYHSYKQAHNLFDKIPHTNNVSTNKPMPKCLYKNPPSETLDLLRNRLRCSGPAGIDHVLVAVTLKSCRGDPILGSQIHGLAILTGLDSYIDISNSLMNLYCKSGQFEGAFAIFNKLHAPDIVSYNTILSGFNWSDEALEFAMQMHVISVEFDAVTYTTVLAFCSDVQMLDFGLQLHSLIIKSGFECETFVGNALITMYSRCNCMEEAAIVFDEMPIRDLVSWNAMISGYTQGDYSLEAIRVFSKMAKKGFALDHVAFVGAISACGHERRLNLGTQIHGLVIRMGIDTHVSVANVLISMYFKGEMVEHANRVFNSMIVRNVVSWTTMISINEKRAVSIINGMRSDGVYPNEVTFVGLIHAVSTENSAKEGQMIHGLCIRSGFSCQLNVSNSLITMYAKFKSIEDSKKVFIEMNYREIVTWNALISAYTQNGLYQEALQIFYSSISNSKPNEFTFGSVLSAIASSEPVSLARGQWCHCRIIKLGFYTDEFILGALIDMYAKRGSIRESQKVFDEMPQRSLVAWTAMISAHSRHGNFEPVMGLFERMQGEGVRPDSITFLAVLTCCGRKGAVDVGRRIFVTMVRDHSIDPSEEHYACVVDMLARAGRLEEAEEFVGRMTTRLGLSALHSLLGACRTHGNVEMGGRVADALVEMEPMESGAYVLVSNIYAEKGEWDKVAKIRRVMRDRGVKKEVGFSWVDVGDSMHMHGFTSDDKSHPQAEEICEVVEWLGLEMRYLEGEEEIEFC